MHVSKYVLITAAAAILALSVALAYVLGRDSQVEPAGTNVSAGWGANMVEPEPLSGESNVISERVDDLGAQPPEVSSPPPKRREFSAAEERLIEAWARANELCRGSSDEATIDEWCPKRDAAVEAMNRAGICYGHENDASAADHRIHRCGPGSYR